MLNEIILTSVEKLERIINRHLRKWLGVPLSFISIELYSKIAKLQLPLTSVVEEFKAEKARFVMTLKDSPDEKVRQNSRGGSKKMAKMVSGQAVTEAESRLRQKHRKDCSNRKTGMRYIKKLLLEECDHPGEAKLGPRRN